MTIRGINTATPGMTPVGVTGDVQHRAGRRHGQHGLLDGELGPGHAHVEPALRLQGRRRGRAGRAHPGAGRVGWPAGRGRRGAAGLLRAARRLHRGAGAVHGLPHRDARRLRGRVHRQLVLGEGRRACSRGPASAVAGAVPTQFAATGTTKPATITFGAGAQSMFKTPWWGTQTMSPAHWQPGDAILVSSYGTSFQGAPPRSRRARSERWSGRLSPTTIRRTRSSTTR